ncbi:SAM-dependent methyltransferase [Vallitalea sediminicola]
MNVNLTQIASVKKDEKGFYIQLANEFKDGLISLTGFTNLNILWWGNLYDTIEYRKNVVIKKPYKTGPDEVGVFATRSPIRPNPILLTVIYVANVDIKNGRIYTHYIDAEIDTPVLDIKPYFPCTDISKNTGTPEWCAMLPDSIEGSATFDWSSFFNFEE